MAFFASVVGVSSYIFNTVEYKGSLKHELKITESIFPQRKWTGTVLYRKTHSNDHSKLTMTMSVRLKGLTDALGHPMSHTTGTYTHRIIRMKSTPNYSRYLQLIPRWRGNSDSHLAGMVHC